MDGNMTSNRTSTLQFTTGYVIGLIVFNAIFATIGTFGNVLVLIAIIKHQSLQTIPDLFIFSLALADLCVTVFREPLLIYEANNFFESRNYFSGYTVVQDIVNTGNYATIVCLLAVTIDRLIAIQHPFKYQQHCTKKRAIIAIIACWVTAISIGTAVAVYEQKAKIYLRMITILCLISTVAINIHLFFIANRQQNRIAEVQQLGHIEHIAAAQQPVRQTRERKAAKTIALVVGVYILFYVPFLIYTTSQKDKPHFLIGFYYFLSFLMCNSAVNPYIYCMRNTRYRLAFASILRLKRNVQLDTSG